MKKLPLPKTVFRKKLASVLVASCIAFASASYAAEEPCSGGTDPGNPDIPDLAPYDFSEIAGTDAETGASLFIDVNSDDFVLSQSQWFSIQSYVHTALALPVTEAAMKSRLRFQDDTPFSSDYQALLGEYVDINGTANHWNASLYPSIVDLALDLSNYSNIHLTFISPLIDRLSMFLANVEMGDFVAAQADVNAAKNYLNILMYFSNSRLNEVENVKQELLQFSSDLAQQSGNLSVYATTFSDLLNQDNTEAIRESIDDKNDRIQEINDEIAKKKRDVGLTAIGGGISLLIGGSILGAQIQQLKDEMHILENEIDDLEGDLAHAIGLYQSYGNATISIDNIETKINEAIPYIESLKGHWQDIRSEFTVLSQTLTAASSECGLGNADFFVGGFAGMDFIALADENWVNIANLAQSFAQNAYVTIQE